MPNPRNVVVGVATLGLQIIGTATFFVASVLFSWQQTRSPARTLLVAVVGGAVMQLLYVRYAARQRLRRKKMACLPVFFNQGGTDL
jgi:hypothetical protein